MLERFEEILEAIVVLRDLHQRLHAFKRSEKRLRQSGAARRKQTDEHRFFGIGTDRERRSRFLLRIVLLHEQKEPSVEVVRSEHEGRANRLLHDWRPDAAISTREHTATTATNIETPHGRCPFLRTEFRFQ